MAMPARFERVSDEALLAAVHSGDDDAAAVFVRRFQRRVYGLAVTITGDVTLAEDVAQQAFVRAWSRAGSYDARRGTLTTWLLAITRNLAIDAVRVRRPGPLDPTLIAELVQPAEGPDPELLAETHDEISWVSRRLAALPVEQRRAVLLATVAARTTSEISEIEGIPVGTAKTRLRTGLRRLREATARQRR